MAEYCYRHKTTKLENGTCPECGWQAITETIHVTNGPTLSAVTMTDGANSTTTEWVETKTPKVIKTKLPIITPKADKKKGKK